MWKRLSLRSRLITILLGIALLAAGIVIALGAWVGIDSITQEVNHRLVSARNAKVFEVEAYFKDLTGTLEVLAEAESSGRYLTELDAAFRSINDSDTINCGVALSAYYDGFIDRLSRRLTVRRDVSAFYPQSPAACYLQYHYLVRNPHPADRSALNNAGDGSAYSNLHERLHPAMRHALEEFDLYDIFLVDARSRNIIYSVEKEVDFGTSLTLGPYRNSNLAELVDRVIRNSDLTEAQLVDFAFYRPSYGEPAAFLGVPVYYRDEFVGVLAAQLPLGRLEHIMNYGGEWAENGLGRTGEVILVGQDRTLRSHSRGYLEDSLAFIQTIDDQTLDQEMVSRLRQLGPILTVSLHGQNIDRALAGERGLLRVTGYQGEEVLSAYTPLNLPGEVDWALIAEIEYGEAMAPVARFQRLNLMAVAFIVVLITLLAMAITRSLIRPIDRLTAGAEEVRSGNTAVRVEKTADDELGRLTDVFNSMVASIDDQKQEIVQQSQENDALLFNRFPASIAERFRNGEALIVDQFTGVSVLATDLRGTEGLTERPGDEAWTVVQELADRFSAVAGELGMEVIHPAPDGFLAVCGMNIPRLDNVRRIAILGMQLRDVVAKVNQQYELALSLTAGIAYGSVLAGILRGETDNYVIWGATVDQAQRMAASPDNDAVLGSRTLIDLLKGNFHFDDERQVPLTAERSFPAGVLRGRVRDLQNVTEDE